jgi:hypothetical protein
MRGAAEPGIEILALIPERSRIRNLRHGAAEEHGGEIGNPTDVAQRFQDQSGGFPAPRRAAVDTDVSRATQKLAYGEQEPFNLRRGALYSRYLQPGC